MPTVIIFTDLATYGVHTWNQTLQEALLDQKIPTFITDQFSRIKAVLPNLVIFSDSTITSNLKVKEFVAKLNIPYLTVTHLITKASLDVAEGIYKTKTSETLNRAKHRIAVSRSIKEKLCTFTDKPVDVIYPSLPYNIHIGSKTQYRILFDLWGYNIYLTVARLSRTKGYYDLIPAINYMRETDPLRFKQSKFVWVGGGPEELKLYEEVHKNRLEESIIITGQQKPENVANWYAVADYFVLPSLVEGLPIALIEACFHKLPLIITPVDGIEELFRSITTNPSDLGKALCNPPNNGQQGYDIYETNLTQDKTLKKVITCIHSHL